MYVYSTPYFLLMQFKFESAAALGCTVVYDSRNQIFFLITNAFSHIRGHFWSIINAELVR